MVLSMDNEGFADPRRVTFSLAVSGVLGVGWNLRFQIALLTLTTFGRRSIGSMFALAEPRFLVATAIYEGLSLLTRTILVLGLPRTWFFVAAGLGE